MNKITLALLTLFSTATFAQTWVSQANVPAGRHHPISFSLNGKGYAVTGTLSNGTLTDDMYEYDPITDTWATLPNFPGQARSFGIGTTANGKAYLGFGRSTNQRLRDFWSYDASDSTWTQLASCACSGRQHPAMISIGNRIYVGLGNDNTGNLKDWWMYNITTNSWSQIADLPGLARHHPYMFNAGGEVFAGLGHGDNNPNLKVYNDWYKLDTTTNTWITMTPFPGEGRVAGTQFAMNGFGFVLSGDGDNHSFMSTGEMWRYNPSSDTWMQFPPHPGNSIWAPGSFVINDDVYFFGGENRVSGAFSTNLWKFDMAAATIGIEEEILVNTFAYPNPANTTLFWNYDESITDVKVYDTLGELIMSTSADQKKLNISEFKNGLYLVQFYGNSEVVKTSKVIIQH